MFVLSFKIKKFSAEMISKPTFRNILAEVIKPKHGKRAIFLLRCVL